MHLRSRSRARAACIHTLWLSPLQSKAELLKLNELKGALKAELREIEMPKASPSAPGTGSPNIPEGATPGEKALLQQVPKRLPWYLRTHTSRI